MTDARPATLVGEETVMAKYLPGFNPRELYASEFDEAMQALYEMMENESVVPGDHRAFVEREVRRRT